MRGSLNAVHPHPQGGIDLPRPGTKRSFLASRLDDGFRQLADVGELPERLVLVSLVEIAAVPQALQKGTLAPEFQGGILFMHQSFC